MDALQFSAIMNMLLAIYWGGNEHDGGLSKFFAIVGTIMWIVWIIQDMMK